MFKLSTVDRLNGWKKFRSSIGTLETYDALLQTQNFWQSCPFVPFYLDASDISSWPDPWTLIQENYYCDLAKCLGIVYTLHLSNHNNLAPELRVYFDIKNKHTYHIAYFCQGKYVLNLIEGAIVNKEHIYQELKLKHCYTAADLKLEQY